MIARILDTSGRPLAKPVKVKLKIEDREGQRLCVSGSFPRRRGVPFLAGDKFLLQFRDEGAKELGVTNPSVAVAFPKGKIVDFRLHNPLAL